MAEIACGLQAPRDNLRRRGPENALSLQFKLPAQVKYVRGGTTYIDTIAPKVNAVATSGGATTFDLTSSNYVLYVTPANGGAVTLKMEPITTWQSLVAAGDQIPIGFITLHRDQMWLRTTRPAGVTVYVLEQGGGIGPSYSYADNRISLYTDTGAIGGPALIDGQLYNLISTSTSPYDMVYLPNNQGELWILVSSEGRLLKVDVGTGAMSVFGTADTSTFWRSLCYARNDGAGHFWMIGDNGTIRRYNTDGTLANTITSVVPANYPSGMAQVGKQIWVLAFQSPPGTAYIRRINFDGTSAGADLTGNGMPNNVANQAVGGLMVIGQEVWALNRVSPNYIVYRFAFDGTGLGSYTLDPHDSGQGRANYWREAGNTLWFAWYQDFAEGSGVIFDKTGAFIGYMAAGNRPNDPTGLATKPPPMTAPPLLSPTDGSSPNPVVLTWGAAQNAASYEVALARDPTFAAIDMLPTVVGTSYTIPAASPLLGSTSSWRVRGLYDVHPGPWSAARTFLAPLGDSWQGYATGSDPVASPGTTSSVGGPGMGMWVYPTYIALGQPLQFVLAEWSGSSANASYPTRFSLYWDRQAQGFRGSYEYYGPQGSLILGYYTTPVLAFNYWYWVALSVNAQADGTPTVRMVVTQAGGTAPLYDASHNAKEGWGGASPPILPNASDSTYPATLTVGCPAGTGFLCARFHYVRQYAPPSNPTPIVMAPPSPVATRLVNGGALGEHVYNPDRYTGAITSLGDQNGTGLQLTGNTDANAVIIGTTVPG